MKYVIYLLVLILAVGLVTAITPTTSVNYDDCTIWTDSYCSGRYWTGGGWGHYEDCDDFDYSQSSCNSHGGCTWHTAECSEWIDKTLDIPAGPKGDKGDKGDTGATGATGPMGPVNPNADTVDGYHASTFINADTTERNARIAADNSLDHQIDHVEDNVEDLEDDMHEVKHDVHDVEEDVEDLEEDVEDVEHDLTREEWTRWMADRHLSYEIDQNYEDIMSNNQKWSQDSSGIGVGVVSKMILGYDSGYSFLRNYKGGYNDYMLEQVKELIMLDREYLLSRMELGLDAPESLVIHQATRKAAKRLGITIFLPDGYQCDAQMCVLFEEIPPAPILEVIPPKTEVINSDDRNCDYWTTRCEIDGFSKACNIAVSLGC